MRRLRSPVTRSTRSANLADGFFIVHDQNAWRMVLAGFNHLLTLSIVVARRKQNGRLAGPDNRLADAHALCALKSHRVARQSLEIWSSQVGRYSTRFSRCSRVSGSATPSGSREHVATLVTLNPIVRVARVPLHPRERFRVRAAAVGAGRRRGMSGRRGNRVRGRNETGARSFHDALQWRSYTVSESQRATGKKKPDGAPRDDRTPAKLRQHARQPWPDRGHGRVGGRLDRTQGVV